MITILIDGYNIYSHFESDNNNIEYIYQNCYYNFQNDKNTIENINQHD